MKIVSSHVICGAQFFGCCDALHRARQAREQTRPAVTGGGEQVKERCAVIWEYALLYCELARETDHAGMCGACHAGDLCTWTTFHAPFCFTITRLSLCDATFTPSGEAVLMSNV